MKLLVGLAVLAFATLPAFAQDASSASASPSVAASPPPSSASSAPAPTASATGFTFPQVMGSIASAATETVAISAIDKKATVTFVEVHLLPGYEANALTFTQAQSDALTALHKAMGRNNALMKKLRKAGYLLDDVIAVLPDPSGAPVVFIDL